MSRTADPRCLGGVAPEALAGLALGVAAGVDEAVTGALLDHVAGCDSCADIVGEYRDLLATRSAANVSPAGTAPPKTESHVDRRSRGRILMFPRRVAAAAAALVLVSGVATAYVLTRPRPVIVASAVEGKGRVADYEWRTGFEFGEGVAPEAEVVGSASFVAGPAIGRAILVQAPGGALELVGFEGRREPAWRASTQPKWAQLSDREVKAVTTKCVVTRRSGDRGPGAPRLEETLCLVLRRRQRGALALLDPQSGKVKGIVFHEGVLGADQVPGEMDEALVVVPGERDGERALLLVGEDKEAAGHVPCATLVSTEGAVLQHLRLPRVDPDTRFAVQADRAYVDWSRSEVSIVTSEWMFVSMPIRNGRLIPADARASLGDAAPRLYDDHHGERAFARLVAEQGGAEAFEAKMSRDVHDAVVAFPEGWK